MGKPIMAYAVSFQAHGSTEKQRIPFLSRNEAVTAAMSFRSAGLVSLLYWVDGRWDSDMVGIQQFEARVARIVGSGNIPLSIELSKLSGIAKALAMRVKHNPLTEEEKTELLASWEAVKTTLGPKGRNEPVAEIQLELPTSVPENTEVWTPVPVNSEPVEEFLGLGTEGHEPLPTPATERKRRSLFGN